MSRMIDGDALTDEIMERYCKGCDKRKGIKNGKYRIIYEIGDAPCRACPMDDMKDELENAPTIEPERKKGKWIPVDSYSAYGGDEATWMAHGNPIAFYYCSECKEQTYADENGDSILSKFCPNCGARMEAGEQR